MPQVSEVRKYPWILWPEWLSIFQEEEYLVWTTPSCLQYLTLGSPVVTIHIQGILLTQLLNPAVKSSICATQMVSMMPSSAPMEQSSTNRTLSVNFGSMLTVLLHQQGSISIWRLGRFLKQKMTCLSLPVKSEK